MPGHAPSDNVHPALSEQHGLERFVQAQRDTFAAASERSRMRVVDSLVVGKANVLGVASITGAEPDRKKHPARRPVRGAEDGD